MTRKASTVRIGLFSRFDTTAANALALRNANLTLREDQRRWRASTFYSKEAETLLRFIAHYRGGIFRPDRCDVYEPIRELFDPSNLSDPIKWLSQPSGRVMLKKTKPFKYVGFVENLRWSNLWQGTGKVQEIVERPPDRVFLTEWCFWIDQKALKHLTPDEFIAFFKELSLVSEGDFGFLSMDEDHKNKNMKVTRYPTGIGTVFVGDNLEKCLPGVYWVNLFGKLYVDWFGRDKFESLPCYRKEELRDGSYLVQVAESPEYYGTPEGVEAVRAVITHLGERAFFDISNPDRECTVPPFPPREE